MATAAKKPASKPVASSPKKLAAKAAAPVNETPQAKSRPTPTRAKVAPTPDQPKAVAPIKTSAKLPVRKPEADVASLSVPEKPLKTMKTTEIKTPVAKSAAKIGAAKPAKASKKISGIPQNDAELMAMPESDYMNKAQLTYFKAKLTLMRDEILENARETGVHLKENEVFADPNDRATVEEENLLEQRVRDRERKLLKKINSSIARIEEGEYGFCQETGDPIGIPRLLARPTAELSIEAQEKHERLEKLYAD